MLFYNNQVVLKKFQLESDNLGLVTCVLSVCFTRYYCWEPGKHFLTKILPHGLY